MDDGLLKDRKGIWKDAGWQIKGDYEADVMDIVKWLERGKPYIGERDYEVYADGIFIPWTWWMWLFDDRSPSTYLDALNFAVWAIDDWFDIREDHPDVLPNHPTVEDIDELANELETARHDIESIINKAANSAAASAARYATEKTVKTLEQIQRERESLEKQLEKLKRAEQRAAERERKRAEREAAKALCREDSSGFVYLLQGPHGHYKIGRTNNPDNRLRTFSVKLPFPVEYVCVIATDDMFALEAQLHEQYDAMRGEGEWFALKPEHVEEIKALAA